MKNLSTLFLIFFTFYVATSQSTFTNNSNTSILFGDNLINLDVTGLVSNMNASFGLEKVCIDASHDNLPDISISLISPNGSEISLTTNNGTFGDSYTNTCFTGIDTDPLISSGSGTYTGNYQSEEQLGIFNLGSEDPNGTWTLKINDNFSFFDGTLNSFSLTFSDSPALIPSAQNDDCDQSINIDINNNYGCFTTTTANIVDANPSQNIPQCNINTLQFDDDIWFDFTAISTAHEFTFSNIIGTSTELIYQVLEGTCQSLTEIYCDEGLTNNFNIKNLTVGSKYFLRIASKTSNQDQNITFDICIKLGTPDPPINDECSGAILIPNSGGCTQVSGTVEGATASPEAQSCPEAGSFSNDVWFKFIANESNMLLKVSDIVGLDRNLDFQFSTGSCGNLTQRFCFFEGNPGDNVLIAANNLSQGSTYFVRVSTFTNAPKNTSFNICIDTPSQAPDNDDCSGAFTVIPGVNNCTPVSGTLSGATGQASGFNCEVSYRDYFDDDVWFQFQASQTSHTINIQNIVGSSDDLIYEVLTGSCGNFTAILCQDDPNESISLFDLNIGQTYFLRIASFLDLVANTTFEVCIGENKLLVTNTSNSGSGSLRSAVDFASAGDTIKFASSINGQSINILAPAIEMNKQLVLHNNFGDKIIISNQDVSNTQDLLIIDDVIRVEGLEIQSNPQSAMKVLVKNGGSLEIYTEN